MIDLHLEVYCEAGLIQLLLIHDTLPPSLQTESFEFVSRLPVEREGERVDSYVTHLASAKYLEGRGRT